MERLCAEGLVLLLFCTETCAVGLNFPAKSVAFSFTKSGLLKCDGCNMRMVRTGEYQQMAGRAGRRGLDKHGNVLFCMSNRKDESEQKAKANAPPGMSQMMKQLILNSAEPVMSSYMLRFPLMLNLLKFGHAGYVKWLFLQTFRQFQEPTSCCQHRGAQDPTSYVCNSGSTGFLVARAAIDHFGDVQLQDCG